MSLSAGNTSALEREIALQNANGMAAAIRFKVDSFYLAHPRDKLCRRCLHNCIRLDSCRPGSLTRRIGLIDFPGLPVQDGLRHGGEPSPPRRSFAVVPGRWKLFQVSLPEAHANMGRKEYRWT